MITLLSFVVLILVVVSVHEYGHYLAARWMGVRVLRFSVGLGKPLFLRVDKRNTEWVLAPIPLGGYVRLLSEKDAPAGDLAAARSESMEAKKYWQRIFIYAAGPAANLILSALIMIVLLSGGEVGIKPIVGEVRDNSPAQRAGIVADETVSLINGEPARLWRDVEAGVVRAVLAGDAVRLRTERGSDYVIATEGLSADDIGRGPGRVVGLLPDTSYVATTVRWVEPESPAARAGIRERDVLVAINGRVVDDWNGVLDEIIPNPGRAMAVVLWRGERPLTTAVTLQSRAVGGTDVGRLGVAPMIDRARLASLLTTVSYSLPALLGEGARRTAGDAVTTMRFVGLLLGGGASMKNVGGPIGIASQSGEVAGAGFVPWLRFVALISVSLAIINLLPLPLLDGGQILLNVLQFAVGRDFPDRWLRVWDTVGAALIVALFVFVIVGDIIRLLA